MFHRRLDMFSMGRLLCQKRVVLGRGPCIVQFGILLSMFFCLFVMAGFIQKSFDSILSMSSFSSHLCNWCVRFAIIVKLCSLSCLRMCLLRCLMGPLSGYSCMECTNLFVGSIM